MFRIVPIYTNNTIIILLLLIKSIVNSTCLDCLFIHAFKKK